MWALTLEEMWLLQAAMLTYFMQAGFIFLETGSVRTRHMAGISIKNIIMFLAASVVFSAIGYKLMYGASYLQIIGLGNIDSQKNYATGYYIFYQTGFAAVTATIISGAIAERTKLFANVVAAMIISLIVFPIYGHWIWGNGWLSWNGGAIKAYDFAGSSAVHFIGGIAALVGAALAGPREGRFDRETKAPKDVGTRALPLAATGVLFLWIGWIGFNGGTKSILFPGQAIGRVVQTTSIAASAGAFAVILLTYITYLIKKYLFSLYDDRVLWHQNFFALFLYKTESRIKQFCQTTLHFVLRFIFFLSSESKSSLERNIIKRTQTIWEHSIKSRQQYIFSPYATLSGTMGGMIAITACCDIIAKSPNFTLLAFFVGLIGGISTYIAAWFVLWVLCIDDPIEAVAVHAGAGAAGILMAAALHPQIQVINQVIALIAGGTFTAIVMGGTFLILHKFDLLRVDSLSEKIGLTFDYRTPPIGLPPLETRHLDQDLQKDVRDFIDYIIAGPLHQIEGFGKRLNELVQSWQVLSEPERKHKLEHLTKLIVHEASEWERISRLETTMLNLNKIVHKVVSEYQEKSPSVDISFSLTSSDHFVEAQEQLLLNAIRMLLSNAVKSCQKKQRQLKGSEQEYKGKVRCRIGMTKSKSPWRSHCISIYVEDNGTGVSEEIIHRLGEPFITREHTEPGRPRRRGLGLFLARFAAETFGGYLLLSKNTKGEGATFEFVLQGRKPNTSHGNS